MNLVNAKNENQFLAIMFKTNIETFNKRKLIFLYIFAASLTASSNFNSDN